MALLAITVVIGQFRTSYLDREAAARSQTEHYVKAMEAHVLYSIQSVDLSLIGFSNALKVLPAKQSNSTSTVSALLSASGSSFNNDYWIIFINPQGIAVAISNAQHVSGIDYSDRDYFKVHVNNSMGNKPFIGEPALGRYSHEKLFFLSRRVESATGEFLGVVVAPLKVQRYVTVFENSRFSSDISIALVHGNGKVIARVPDVGSNNDFMRDIKSSLLFEQIGKAHAGTYKTRDQHTALFSYRLFEDFPLVIVVGSSDIESARLLQKDYLLAGAGLATLLLLMAGGGHFSLRTYLKQEERESRLQSLYSASREMEKKLQASEKSMRLAALLFENSSEGMMVTDADGRILTVNPAFTALSGYTEAELVGHRSYELTAGRQDLAFFTQMYESIAHSGQWKGELWHQHKDGGHFLAGVRFDTVSDEQGKPSRYVALLSDITKKKESEELIWRQANFDTLTGLPNRRMFHEHLRQEMKKTDRSHLPMALVFVDLDYFKEVNDTLGHDKGDLLLKQVAERLSNAVRGSDTVARLGGDEFTAIISELRSPADVLRTVQKILSQMNLPFMLGEGDDQQIAQISSSIGITLYPEDGDDVETLMNNADQAMYAAKEQGRNRFNYFAPFMQEATRTRLALVNDLRDAVERDELRILFQPIVDLASGRICKAEALVRWQHPLRGLLNPAEFLGAAESSGLIVSIGDWVFQQAAREVAQLRQQGWPHFQISVNKSAWQFRDDGSHFQQWLAFFSELQLDTDSIVIEVTENLLLESVDTVSERMLALEHAHMQISLDNFGSGACPVAFLKRFNIDYLKIDPTLVANIGEERYGQAICEAMIAMAQKLGIKIIAQGVDQAAQVAVLKAAGCDFGQGSLFSAPISGAELRKLLENQPGL